MKAVWCLLVVLLSRQATCGIVRSPPAFSKPVYLDSYLPAAMQVIFHAVEQLKLLQSEEPMSSSTAANAPTSPITPQNQHPTTQASPTVTVLSDESTEETSKPGATSNGKPEVPAPSDASKNKTEESKIEVTSQSDETTIPGTPADETEESKPQTTPSNQPDQSKLDEPPANKINQSSPQESSENKAENEKPEELDSSKLNTTPSNQSDQTEANEASISKIDESKPQEPFQIEEFELEESPSAHVEGTLAPIDQGSMDDPSVQPELPEMNEETPETNYATPESNYEEPEAVHAVQETNEEVPEENHEWAFSSATETKLEATTAYDNPVHGSIVDYPDRRKEPTVDSVVQGVYQILKPTPSKFADEGAEALEASKSVVGVSVERTESVEEEQDETRFTRLGERVTQVPRPSLTSYLRRSKVPPNATLQQLANLYDSLSKDARKQGFGKYTGYSNEVLGTLESSAEGGIGPQLKKILSKVLERNELTRDDARTRTSQAVRDLDNPSSVLSKELRPLLPLRYSP